MIATKPFKIKNLTIPHQLILAPMCGITLQPFRQICKENGAGLVFNQMVSAKALVMKDKKSFKMLSYTEAERPVGMQLFGNEPDSLSEAARMVSDTGADIVDLNLGCPAKKIVNDGGGSALMTDTKNLVKIIKKMRQALPGVFTVKIRAGWDEKSKNAVEIAKMSQEEGVDAIAIHARTRTQGYSGNSDWSFIKELKDSISIPVIGNGDIKSASDAQKMLQETNCDAVMTGRAAIGQPWIFANFVNNQDSDPTTLQKKEMILRQYQYFIDYFGLNTGIKMMRKFLCAYTKGLRNGSQFRNKVVRLDDWSQIQSEIEAFFIN